MSDLESLIQDLELSYFIPKKYRRAPFTDELRLEYIRYLKRELKKIASRKAH